ncbi:MAG: hypothetical protein PHI48_13845 [Bacteroidales bacterium]|nr:hypothetical protein [Bacteroidales bacterium]MDD4823625.1 hypothetical protein [Bacteroidales bacterium]
MAAQYDLFKSPVAHGEEEDKGLLHARIVNGAKVTGHALLTEIADASSFTLGDLKGMVSAVTGAMARHLAEGDVVELEGLGYLSVSLKSLPTAVRSEVNAANVRFGNVHLRTCGELKKVLSSMRLMRREKSGEKAERLPAERLALALEFIHKQVFMSRMDYQRLVGCNKSMALRDLNFWVEASLLFRYGSGNQIAYFSKDLLTL